MATDVAVIGAGAAGLMAAVHAAGTGARVTLLERTADGGRKILISGGGRCNVLPSELDERRFVTDSSRATMARLLRAWPLAGQREFFERSLGIPLALEPDTGKLFPVSNRARDVRDGLVRAARDAGAELRFGVTVSGIERDGEGWQLRTREGPSIAAGRIVLATGGLSVPATGSDGTGLAMAAALGHEINPTYPALTPLTAEPPIHQGLAGVSLEVAVKGRWAGREATSRGGFLFTHRGYSGPSVLDVSHLAVRARQAGDRSAEILIQWTAEDGAAWDERLRAQSRQAVATVVRAAVPARLAERLIEECGVDPGRTLAQLPKKERRLLVEALTRYRLPWSGDEGYKKAEVTGGGVALGEIEPGTLESRRVPGLFLCGEILDAFGPIGGYNFAWAWATGRAAGLAAGRPTPRD